MADCTWSHSRIIELIEVYKSKPILWDPLHPDNKNLTTRNVFWKEVAEHFQSSVLVIRKKVECILSSHRREMAKVKRSKGKIKPQWFAYKHLEFIRTRTDSGSKRFRRVPSKINSNDQSSNESAPSPSRNSTSFDEEMQYSSDSEQIATISANCSQNSNALSYPLSSGQIKKEEIEEDDSTIFGELVARKLRKYNTRTRNVAEHMISNILFDADMGKYKEHLANIIKSTGFNASTDRKSVV